VREDARADRVARRLEPALAHVGARLVGGRVVATEVAVLHQVGDVDEQLAARELLGEQVAHRGRQVEPAGAAEPVVVREERVGLEEVRRGEAGAEPRLAQRPFLHAHDERLGAVGAAGRGVDDGAPEQVRLVQRALAAADLRAPEQVTGLDEQRVADRLLGDALVPLDAHLGDRVALPGVDVEAHERRVGGVVDGHRRHDRGVGVAALEQHVAPPDHARVERQEVDRLAHPGAQLAGDVAGPEHAAAVGHVLLGDQRRRPLAHVEGDTHLAGAESRDRGVDLGVAVAALEVEHEQADHVALELLAIEIPPLVDVLGLRDEAEGAQEEAQTARGLGREALPQVPLVHGVDAADAKLPDLRCLHFGALVAWGLRASRAAERAPGRQRESN
jgi:hypothetical protein